MITVELINEVLGKPAVVSAGAMPANFTCFSMDTRTLAPDELFFAIKGEARDGHDFLPQVAQKAKAAIVSCIDERLDLTQWLVEDVTLAMGQLAKALRTKYRHIPLVGITGSCGKTSCTRLLDHICSQAAPTLASQKSFNNKWGVPLTLSHLDDCYAYVVQEMGMNIPKEIEYITRIAQPDVAMITIIAPVHLEGLGSLDGIAQEKSDIYLGLSAEGTAVINADDPYKDFLQSKLLPTQKIMTFSLQDNSVDVSLANEPRFTKTHSHFKLKIGAQSYDVDLPLLGIHNVANVLGVAACALALGIDEHVIVSALATAKPAEQRMVRHITAKGYTILDDSYNANPLAMKMAFQTLAREDGRLIAILGDMTECGDQAEAVHRQLAHDLKESGIETVFSTGKLMAVMHDEASKLGLMSVYHAGKQDLIEQLQQDLQLHDTVLVKGSNASGMQAVVEAIL